MAKNKWTIIKTAALILVGGLCFYGGAIILLGKVPVLKYLGVPALMGFYVWVMSWVTAENFQRDGIISEDSFWFKWYKVYSVVLGVLFAVVFFFFFLPSPRSENSSESDNSAVKESVVKTIQVTVVDKTLAYENTWIQTDEKGESYVVNASNDTLVLYRQHYGILNINNEKPHEVMEIILPGDTAYAQAEYIMCDAPKKLEASIGETVKSVCVLQSINCLPEDNSIGSDIMIVYSRSKQTVKQCYPWHRFEVKSRNKTICFQPEKNKDYLVNLMSEPLCIVKSDIPMHFGDDNMTVVLVVPAGGYSKANLSAGNSWTGSSGLVPMSSLPANLKREARHYLDSIGHE